MPEKFTSFRDNQLSGLDLILSSTKRGVATSVPTGGGKSLMYMAAAVASGVPTCIVTQSRGLQDQLMSDFGEIGLVDIRGKRNYQCDMREDYTCDEGHISRCPYKGTIACAYSQAEMRAASSSLVVTNYDKWVASRRAGKGMDHFKQVIYDEGHFLPDALASAMQVILHHHEIEKDLGLDFLSNPEAEDFANWKLWAGGARIVAEAAMRASQERIKEVTNPKPAWVRHYAHMRNLLKKLAILASANPHTWVADETKEGFQFDPIRPGIYAESTILFRIPKIIVVSATLRPKTMYMVNMAKDTFDYKEYDSDFDPKRSPIYYVPTMRVDARNTHMLPLLWAKLDQIAAKRRDRRGIVQTVSFGRQQDIMQASRFWESMVFNEKGEPPTEVVEQFLAVPEVDGPILVSPSIGTGYDFKDSACRWNFLCKIPFDPPSKILKAREEDDKEYRAYRAMQTMCQNFGRDVRSKTDWSERFIGDKHIEWFMPRYAHLAPRSFHTHFKRVEIVPPAPRKEDMDKGG